MSQTYKQIQKQIEALQRQAEKLRNQEVEGVVGRIKVAITHYGLTAEQLGFGTGSAKGKLKTPRTNVASKSTGSAKYSDGQGNEWLGRGPRPHWLREALAAGKSLEDFAIASPSSTTSARAAKPAAKRKAKTSYKDPNGNTWSGMGPKPRWLKDALSAGATLDQFVA
ncbi:H-NS family nucleoid-associated regulatory protein [Variovorax sp. N23]|uniref:H-NS family nucleoid-associated regulatory protein n=1 Tax=Variovorax sp. N23 TaxID=2980555 RepID=UPI0021C5FA88|nr:H-NS family nucleoid-associated regulatory protein [Variovorax sp. N23]MCU4121542.1 H-NS histone family protein [Variovorax sp. N23]